MLHSSFPKVWSSSVYWHKIIFSLSWLNIAPASTCDATQLEEWRAKVEKLADSSSEQFRLQFPETTNKWRVEHAITWLAGCAPALDSEDLLYLRKSKMNGTHFKGFLPVSKPIDPNFPIRDLQPLSYVTIREALQQHKLLPQGILLCFLLLCGAILLLCNIIFLFGSLFLVVHKIHMVYYSLCRYLLFWEWAARKASSRW